MGRHAVGEGLEWRSLGYMTQGKDASCMGLRMVLPFLSKMAKLRSTLFTQGTWDALIGNPTKKPHNVEEFLGI